MKMLKAAGSLSTFPSLTLCEMLFSSNKTHIMKCKECTSQRRWSTVSRVFNTAIGTYVNAALLQI